MSIYSVLSSAVQSGSLSYLRDGNVPFLGFKKVIFILPTSVKSSAVILTRDFDS